MQREVGAMRNKYAQFLLQAALAALCTATAEQALALDIVQNLDFEAVNQNPFTTGSAYVDYYDQAIPLPTQRTDFPGLIIPLSAASYPRVTLGGSVTGEMNLDFWASVNTGRLNINYPVQTTFTVPDSLSIGQTFSLGSSGNVLPAGYTDVVLLATGLSNGGLPYYLQQAQISSGLPSMTTSNPGIAAGVDLNITNHNYLYAEGCATPLDITCAYIVQQNLPSVGSQTITLLSASTLGNVQILPDVPGAGYTFSLPETFPLGNFASFTVDKPDLGQNGALVGSDLKASTTSNVATVTVDIDQLLSDAVLNPLLLPPLTGNLGPVGYSLLDANASLSGGLYQTLDFNVTNTQVTLVFDHDVRAKVNGVDKGVGKVLQFNVGDDVKLSPVGFVTDIHVVPSFRLVNMLHNRTGIELTGSLDVNALEASLDSLGSTGYLFQDSVNVPLGQLQLYQSDFPVDIKDVWATPFDLHFGLNQSLNGVSIHIAEIAEASDGTATFMFTVDRQDGVTSQFNVSGRVQRTLCGGQGDITYCTGYFLADADVMALLGGDQIDLGDTFCWFGDCTQADDLSFLDNLIHAATADGFDPVYFADAAQDFLVNDPELADVFTSHNASNPDPGFVYAYNPDFFDQLTAVPEPGTIALVGLGIAGLGAMRRRRASLTGQDCSHTRAAFGPA
jgi:PEP-CTERM motif